MGRPARTLRDLLEAAVGHLAGIRRAVDAQREVLTLAQAARALQLRDSEAVVWLRSHRLVRDLNGHERVLRSELVQAIARPTDRPATLAGGRRGPSPSDFAALRRRIG